MKNKRKIFIIVGIFTVLIGIMIIFFGINMSNTNRQKKSYYILTNATIVDYDSSESTNSDGFSTTVYGTIAEYKVNGKTYRIYPKSYTSPKSLLPRIGEVVQIRYNPNSPSDAIWENNEIPYVVLIFGAIFMLAGLLFTILPILEKHQIK